jgi:predicted PurR-regulated permease PerM
VDAVPYLLGFAGGGIVASLVLYRLIRFVAERFVVRKWAALIAAVTAAGLTLATGVLAPTGIITAIVLLLRDMSLEPKKTSGS